MTILSLSVAKGAYVTCSPSEVSGDKIGRLSRIGVVPPEQGLYPHRTCGQLEESEMS